MVKRARIAVAHLGVGIIQIVYNFHHIHISGALFIDGWLRIKEDKKLGNPLGFLMCLRYQIFPLITPKIISPFCISATNTMITPKEFVYSYK